MRECGKKFRNKFFLDFPIPRFIHSSILVFSYSRILAFSLLLSACGFEPVHGRHAQDHYSAVGLERVAVSVEGDQRLSQLLEAELADQLNPDYVRAPKDYTLSISITETLAGVFINPDGTSSRNNVNFDTTYILTKEGEQNPHDQGVISRVSSYNISERADYATFVAQQDARKRAVLELARAYKFKLAGILAREASDE